MSKIREALGGNVANLASWEWGIRNWEWKEGDKDFLLLINSPFLLTSEKGNAMDLSKVIAILFQLCLKHLSFL